MVTRLDDMEPSTTYSFTIHNRSGGKQDYALFTDHPDVDPAPDHITSHAILVAKGVPPTSGVAAMVISRNDAHAICGTLYQDQSVRVQIFDKRKVSLGVTAAGASKPGTTCIMNADAGTPSFLPWAGSADDAGENGAFCVKTGDFTFEEARTNGYLLALGVATSTSAQVGLLASFSPRPNVTYQLQPSLVFHIVAVDMFINQPKPLDHEGFPAVTLDFSLRPPHVQLVHGDDNKLSILEENDVA